MSDDDQSDESDIPSEGPTRMFSMKMESWLGDIVPGMGSPAPQAPAEGQQPAGGPPKLGYEGGPPVWPGPPAAPPPASPDYGSPAVHRPSSPDPFHAPTLERLASGPSTSASFQGPSSLDPNPAAVGVPAASAVPPIPGLAGSAVPPIPALAGGAPTWQHEPRRWPMVIGLLAGMLVVGGGVAWLVWGTSIAALLGK